MKVDPRVGSKDYLEPLRQAGVPVESAHLDFGDFELQGQGPDGRPVLIGVELKQVGDLLQCVRDGRAAEQLRGMRRNYEVCWLLIEGFMTVGDGDLYVMERGRTRQSRGGFKYQEVAGWLFTMAQAGGTLLARTSDQAESVAWLRSLWHWWQQPWEGHRSHLAMYQPPLPMDGFEEPPLRQRVAAVLPGIGPTRSAAVAEYFPSIEDMLRADAAAWAAVEGIGPKTAAKVVAALKGTK